MFTRIDGSVDMQWGEKAPSEDMDVDISVSDGWAK
jgi:hypothetical protein